MGSVENGKFWYVLLGASLSFVGQIIFQLFKNWSVRRMKTKNFILFVRLELQVVAKTLEKLNTALDYGNYYDYSLLDRIKESLTNLEKARNDVIYLTDPDLKEKFIDVISDVSTYITIVRSVQELFYKDQRTARELNRNNRPSNRKKNASTVEDVDSKAWSDFNARKSDRKIEYIDIKRRLDDLVKTIDAPRN